MFSSDALGPKRAVRWNPRLHAGHKLGPWPATFPLISPPSRQFPVIGGQSSAMRVAIWPRPNAFPAFWFGAVPFHIL